ncbi:threonine dehydratase [Desulfacinum hydrothermale DSM 13146]|uniref:Threonine dehydratase n=1 Tax=Desulfacinum hydrothermale DSM 13146 TaxID=1121390 RepID=A0A1W1X094_9BACT|nr:pyridoxal-phosphate dependent enzyme [Desulfacinum hydrothermale]SMC17379.1 threonine dehydratase [Desulfacinum hydrothermale DSM 13146]
MEKHYEESIAKVNMLEVFKARRIVERVLTRTHLTAYRRLSEELGAEVYVKHENHLPTNSFKVRGAVNFMAQVPPQVVRNGIVVATKGNHGLAVAWAAQERGIFCNVVVPENNNPELNANILATGAQLIEQGSDFYEAQDYCEELAENAGYYYLRQGNEPLLITGIATLGLEIFEELPDVEAILMPIGGGTGCAALATVIQGIHPQVELIGVQAANMPSFYESWRQGKKVVVPAAETVADGLAARSAFEVPWAILKDCISDVVLLSEEELLEGVRLAVRYTQNLAEVAGAASLAAAFKIRDRLRGKKVVAVMTGGNIRAERLRDLL